MLHYTYGHRTSLALLWISPFGSATAWSVVSPNDRGTTVLLRMWGSFCRMFANMDVFAPRLCGTISSGVCASQSESMPNLACDVSKLPSVKMRRISRLWSGAPASSAGCQVGSYIWQGTPGIEYGGTQECEM